MDNIQKNLDYFKTLTQRTLSAFHLSGTEESYIDEIAILKRIIHNVKYKTLVTIEPLENNKIKKIFSDSSFEICTEDDILNPSLYVFDDEFNIIIDALNRNITPILSLRLGNEIILVDNKEIKEISEKIFFLD